ncbi:MULTISPECIES: phosphonate metabolism transcriptional regulator PhnF [unclassified Pseudodesulfovibrio]|uniref:phosphonate metabolism transcriptional regulator PhnF n=1 Tax=unclassified Pseudodesulfovibrio TaxID=2661612 RepID=UPI000FEB6B72|nr:MULTISPECIES: phosphonate metabolism transcriptional regulator PhnF [unclassified Pseudodesulfovibrio]MCJ2165282.1 phosphonate metabolism transcriptional regulator PhnF [Pseudodesulfovibrio sp. S3-i]RWU03333.1 phosphonate metabolism transcriptional regulator PhnF [Pseudodesulfovibrio sp. S3]
MLIRGNGVALWRQIYSQMEADIASGRFGPGDRLPSESSLSAEFGVNRHTIRRALAVLEEGGLIRVEQGRGSFVREPVIHYPVSRRTRFSENLSRQRREPGNILLMAVDTEADGVVAEALGIRPGEVVTRITSAGEADGRRISYSKSYFPRALFPGMVRVYREYGSVTRTLEHFGVGDYSRKRTRIISRMPTAEEARELAQPKTRPVLITESVNVDESGVPVEFGVCLFASDWVQILVE